MLQRADEVSPFSGAKTKILYQAVSLLLIFALSLVVFSPMAAANGEPAITGGGAVNGLVDQQIAITGLEITGDSVDPIPMTIAVAGGQLSMTTTTGLTFSRGPVGSKLAFTGSKADINAALSTLQFRTTRLGTFNVSVTVADPGLVYFPGNGHLYEVVNHGSGISWDDAKIAAESRTMNGATGYLATITSAEENDYISARLEDDGWMGASDVLTEGDWKWATGPESGTSFWLGLGDGAPVDNLFSQWRGGEPNDSGGEDCAQYYTDGYWNDMPCDYTGFDYYVVEYGGPGDMPNPPSNTTVSITTAFPEAEDVNVSSCLDLIDTAVTNQNDNRYNNLTLTQDIDCTGEVIAPLFNDTFITEDEEENDPIERLGFRGVFEGNGHTISNLTVQAPTESNHDLVRTGFFAATDGATISNINFSGGTVKSASQDYVRCTGGVVGEAVNTEFSSINSDLAVSAGDGGNWQYSFGGLVGCLYGDMGTSSLTDIDTAGSVSGYGGVGGIIGSVYAQNAGSVLIENSYSDAVLAHDQYGYNAGGVAGEAYSEDLDSEITFINNGTAGIEVEGSTSGGIVGRAEAEDGGVITLESNSVVGKVQNEGTIGGIIGSGSADDTAKLYISNTDLALDVTASDSSYAGGIAGELYAEGSSDETKIMVEDVSYEGAVTGTYSVGGISGSLCTDYGDEEVVLRSATSAGTVSGSQDNTGGLVGRTCGALIEDSASSADVSAYEEAGGLVGSNYSTMIYQSFATGDVVVEDDLSGGIAGRNSEDSQISESFASGSVVGVERIGGIAGANGALIVNSFSSGDVTGESQVGGIAGRCGSEIQKSYARGLVTGNTNTGGVLGSDQGCDITDSFWDVETTSQATSAGSATGKTTQEMLDIANYTDLGTVGLDEAWDFQTVWSINALANDGYPCLQWAELACLESDQAVLDEDNDGIAGTVEDGAPNNGDANNDGTPDSQQANVTSFVNEITGSYVSLETTCNSNLNVQNGRESSEANDGAYNYPAGLIGFIGQGCGQAGATATITLRYYGSLDANSLVLRKWAGNNTYFTINEASISSQVIASLPVVVVTYQVADGGLLDQDGVADGNIVDPVGLAQLVVGVPNTGLGGSRR